MNIGVVFGSRSPEHDVSITTGYAIVKGLQNMGKHTVFPLYITREGQWIYDQQLEDINNFKHIDRYKDWKFSLDMSQPGKFSFVQKQPGLVGKKHKVNLDMIFVCIHGLSGEDGSIQGLCEMLQVPYISSSVLGSGLGMNKNIMKELFLQHEVPVVPYLSYPKGGHNIEEINSSLTYPLFVKPGNLGSSIGVSKVSEPKDLEDAIELAAYYDHEIIIESGVQNLIELNCSVMEKDGEIITSVVEQPVTSGEFLSFSEKYTSEDGGTMQGVKAKVKIPAEIPAHVTEQVQALTKKVYQILRIKGGAPRLDFLYDEKNDKLYVNEINTIPGAMQMHLWKASGFEVPEFLEALISGAIEQNNKRKLQIDFQSNIIDHTIAFRK